MAATSHPLATHAALRVMEDGGSAVDGAIAAAAVLCVCEPMSTGIGGDLFSIVWDGTRLHGLNASGRAPAAADPEALAEMPELGPQAVTVPGAVSGWAALSERHGRAGLDRVLAPAIDAAERGYAVTPVIARGWRASALEAGDAEFVGTFGQVPEVGQLRREPQLGGSLRAIAEGGADAFYRGRIAEAICQASWLSQEDLAGHAPEWVEPIAVRYRGADVYELPPNGQGAVALQALGLLEPFALGQLATPDRVHLQAESLKLAFADAERYLGDAPLPAGFLDAAYLAERRALIDPLRAGDPPAGPLPRGGTVYLCTVDEERRACSLIQSLFYGFGARVAAPGTGIVLQNRGSGFTLEPGHPNRLGPGKRPFHTIIPGMLLRDGHLLGPFGLMGGNMQPQGHVQLLSGLLDQGLDPQAALDAPRFRLDRDGRDWLLQLEPGLRRHERTLAGRGHRTEIAPDDGRFGGGQAILVQGEALVGGSEPRKDGHAAGF